MLAGVTAAPAPEATDGKRIFREGQLASGEALRGERFGAAALLGQSAACVQCHRRSGMGMVEGQIVIPPISGRFLFKPGKRIAPDSRQHEDATHLPPTPPDRPAYDESTLARAIREGVGADGRPLDFLMPRYGIDDASMRDLIAYLRSVPPRREPGLTASTLHFATIVTPDAEPAARDGMLDVLRRYFAVNNDAYAGAAAPAPDGHAARQQRLWQLHVWRLSGAPQTWDAQLERFLSTEPVFATVSGVGGEHWEVVHRFCERHSMPCLLPNVDLPTVSEDYYPVYYSQGVRLEAALIAARVSTARDRALRSRVVQVFRDADIGAAAAATLRSAQLPGLEFIDRRLAPDDGSGRLAEAVAQARAGDILVLWLRAPDIQALPAPPAEVSAVYVSGLMGGLESMPLAAAWRGMARIAYPYELPDARRTFLGFALGWFHLWGVPVVDERVQVDTFIACSILTQALASMIGEYDRDYLIERLEAILSSRLVNGYFPRLSLGPGQRFASKGGYLVRFVEPGGAAIAADGDWTVP